MASKKVYGLITKDSVKSQRQIRPLNALQNSDDELEKSDEESALDWVEASLKKSSGSGQKSAQKRMLREALEEDPSVFQYDEVYDDLKSKEREKSKEKGELSKKPKYINTILRQAEKRKVDQERRQERKVQREREKEGNLFDDKESFVTSSYLKKMDELRKADIEEEVEKIKEEKDEANKDKNVGLFYRNLYMQKIGEGASHVKKEPVESGGLGGETLSKNQLSIADEDRRQASSQDRRLKNKDREALRKTLEDCSDEDRKENKYHFAKRKRRRRRSSSGSSDEENKRDKEYRRERSRETYEKHNSKRGDSSSSELERGRVSPKRLRDGSKNDFGKRKSRDTDDSEDGEKKTSPDLPTKKDQHGTSASGFSRKEEMTDEEKKELNRKWFAKRTCGKAFEEAVKRYFERKARAQESRA